MLNAWLPFGEPLAKMMDFRYFVWCGDAGVRNDLQDSSGCETRVERRMDRRGRYIGFVHHR